MPTLNVRTHLWFGHDALSVLGQIRDVNVVVFTDAFLVKSGIAGQITALLQHAKSVRVFDNVRPDPPLSLVAEGLQFILESEADIVIALGGGSSIDTGKATVYMAKSSGVRKDIRLIAIPTTSGTGSEVTNFAVISDPDKGVKIPLMSDDMVPDIAILDPHLVISAPPRITADTGFDVITHALEAYLSVNANDYSDALAEKSLSIAFEYLPKAYKDGTNLDARDKMHSASCLAGMAFNAVGLGISHGIAHQLGARFHIPHGRANAMLLPHVLLYNADLPSNFGAVRETRASLRIARVASLIGLSGDDTNAKVLSLCKHLTYMLNMTDTPLTLEEAGVSMEAYYAVKPALIDAALRDTCTATNPRPMTPDDVDAILSNIARW